MKKDNPWKRARAQLLKSGKRFSFDPSFIQQILEPNKIIHISLPLVRENALNLDSGGSTALWSGGYKAGPGRYIPNAILFVNR